MIIKPRVKGFICLTAHPQGCAAHVQEQIDYVTAQPPMAVNPKNVLVLGASTGYGLASRITAAFGNKAATLGVFLERPPSDRRTATAGRGPSRGRCGTGAGYHPAPMASPPGSEDDRRTGALRRALEAERRAREAAEEAAGALREALRG